MNDMGKYLNQVITADCFDVLKKLPDNSIDMILTDPPYMISKEVKITRGRNRMKFKGPDINLSFGKWDYFPNAQEYYKFTFRWIDECARVLKPGRILAFWFDRDKINFPSVYLQKRHNFKSKGYFAMIKSNPVPQARKVKWMNGWEMIGLWQKPGGKLVFNYQLGQQPDYMIVPIVGHTTKDGDARFHPTQKHVKIAKLFIQYWTNPGDIVLDPFAGSGTIGVASYMLDRKFILIEAEEKYAELSRQRIDKLAFQMKLQLSKA
ncbi:MAG: site-specific DNA-methyltransferase [candidate division WOR-3 bacterium]